jgi:predicted DNA-binding transcriptional regulator AlpA
MVRQFLRYPEMITRGYFRNRMGARRAVQSGHLPAPYELGPNSIGWADDELDEVDAKRPRREYGQKPADAKSLS